MDELLERLRAELDDIAGGVVADPDLDDRFVVAARRGRQRQRRTTRGVVVLAVLVVVALVAVGVARRSSDRTVFVGQPPGATPAGETGPPPAANVEQSVSDPARGAIPETGWLLARTGRTDRELIVYVMGLPPGCGDGYLAKVDSHVDYVAVTLAEYATTPDTQGQCGGPQGTVERAVLVALPEPLAGRPVVDGARPNAGPDAPSGLVDSSTLQVPGGLPEGYTAQSETLLSGWAVCYSDDGTCKIRTNQTDSQVVPLLADLGLAWSIDPADAGGSGPPTDLRPLLRTATAFQTAGPGQDPRMVPLSHAQVNGNPAVIVPRVEGGRAIVWTDGRWWFSIEPDGHLSLSESDLVALASSMHTVGTPTADTTVTTVAAKTTCGIPYRITGPDGTVNVGSCAGMLSSSLQGDVHLRIGQSLKVVGLTEMDTSGRPIGDPAPDSSAPDVLYRVNDDPRSGTSTFEAKSVGEATLTVVTLFCLDSTSETASPPTGIPCPVARVTVTP